MRYCPIAFKLLNKVIAVYEANAKNKSSARLMLMQRFATFSEVMVIVGVVAYSLAGMFYCINPIYLFYTKNEIIPIMPMFWPIFDETTTFGFSALMISHIIYIVLSIIGIGTIDLLFIMLLLNIPVFVTILRDNINDLNELLRAETVNGLRVRAKLTNILLLHREIWE